MRNRAFVRDDHDALITLWYLIDHNDAMATEKLALDDLISVRDAAYAPGAIAGAVATSWGYTVGIEAGGEVLRLEISVTFTHTTEVS
jgi:hypothetical protein